LVIFGRSLILLNQKGSDSPTKIKQNKKDDRSRHDWGGWGLDWGWEKYIEFLTGLVL